MFQTSPTLLVGFCVWLLCSGTWFNGALIAQSVPPPNDADNGTSQTEQVVEQPKYRAANMPELGVLPASNVQCRLYQPWPAAERWLYADESFPEEAARWETSAWLLPRLPMRYDAWGIRDEWNAPVLVRMAADVELPQQPLRFLLRTRGLARLWMDGRLIAQTEPITVRSPDGEQPITPLAEPPIPGARVRGYRQQEVISQLIEPTVIHDQTSQLRRIVLELIVGGKGMRTETGEVLVAWQNANSPERFTLLTPQLNDALSLTDNDIEPALKEIEQAYHLLDRQTRRAAATSQQEYWQRRHDWARTWAKVNPAPAVPKRCDGAPEHPIDAFLRTRVESAEQEAKSTNPLQAAHFNQQILPILRDQCFRCHGDKNQGGLKLNSRAALMAAGHSEQPAVVPGDPEASYLIEQVRSKLMPPNETGLSDQQIALLEGWIADGAVWPAEALSADHMLKEVPIVSDQTFVRRVYFDTIGLPPSAEEARTFIADPRPDKRLALVERLLHDPRAADHQISFWQDLLAENPTLINQSMGSTGPFRWFLYEALTDTQPLDRMVTELIMMRGSEGTGGSAAFALSGESDSPMAAKAHILASAFLGVELKCARCHDSPYHATTQRDLYSLAAMLARKEQTVPKTSRVPDAFFEKKGRESLIKVSLPLDATLEPAWTLGTEVQLEADDQLRAWLHDGHDQRELLALLITAPMNQRFGRVMVNRLWHRLIGAGLVQPLDDWEGAQCSHPELLDWLVQQLITNDYDTRVVLRWIMTSQLYQREAIGRNSESAADSRYFAAPDRRRLSAEQIVDALHAVTGRSMDSEELTFVHDGARPLDKRQTLGKPTRAWMFASLNNERDRPSLSLPKARTITDVLSAFGWDGSRQNPISLRDCSPDVLQPGILSNGALVTNLTRVTSSSYLSALALSTPSPEYLVDELFQQILGRPPTASERVSYTRLLRDGFETRVIPEHEVIHPPAQSRLPLVTWFNHLQPETTLIQQEHERRVLAGPPADPRFSTHWRERLEDMAWSLINHHEFVWMP